jgi:uncharacterized membrane-anchored protein
LQLSRPISIVVSTILLCAFVALSPMRASAQATSAQTSEEARENEQRAALEAGVKAGTQGPAEVPLLDQAVLNISQDYLFVPRAEAARIMRALGNTVQDTNFVGIIFGTKPGNHFIVVATYIKDGFIKDDDAKNWNAGELLQNLKDGTEEDNKDRAARGFPEIEIIGWVEQPTYDASTHRLVWSMLAKDKGEPDAGAKSINYNTYALGRDGYFSLDLLTNSDQVGHDKLAAQELLSGLTYNKGRAYEDFNASTDHIAEYGIAALVGGVVAKKLGLFALLGVFVAKFFKVIVIGFAAFGAAIMKMFRRKPKAVQPDGPA